MQSPFAFTQTCLSWWPQPLPPQDEVERQLHRKPTMEAMDLSMKSDTSVGEEETSSTSYSSESSPRSDYGYNITTNKLKFARPFKAYKKDFRSVPTVPVSLGFPSFEEFRRKMSVDGQETHTNKNMRRQTQRTSTQSTDPSYLEKRRKNNEAAKRSRDARRQKEDDLALLCAFLEGENTKLKLEMHVMQKELNILRSRCSN